MDSKEIIGLVIGSGVIGVLLTFLIQWIIDSGRVKLTDYQIAMNYIKPSWGDNLFRYFILNLRFENYSKRKRNIKIEDVSFYDGEAYHHLELDSSLKPLLKLADKEINELCFKAFCETLIEITTFIRNFESVKIVIHYTVDGKTKRTEIKGEKLSFIELDAVYVDS